MSNVRLCDAKKFAQALSYLNERWPIAALTALYTP
jgi:hypothetical protein